ncbi:MAG: hypothetical protein JXA41_01835 [Deltaproteobacteria bacterium]|nr:hypothetical protein [Deltaproteobacteria bacterium]
MDEKKEMKKLSMSNTKQEMLDAYGVLLKQLQEKREGELKPEKKVEEKKDKEAIKSSEALTAEGVVTEIGALKLDIGKTLSRISDQLEDQVNKLATIQHAITAKEKEIQELYEIEKSAMTLAALIEAQNQKRQEFNIEMEEKKEALNQEIDEIRSAWLKEREEYNADIKERDETEKKSRARAKEEFEYTFKREQQLATEKFSYEKAKLETELKDKKEKVENELATREDAIAEKEEELNELRKRAAGFAKELEAAVAIAVKEITDRLTFESKSKEDLLRKEYEGEKNVFKTRIDSLDRTVKEQQERMALLSQQLEAAYQKVQDIAVKTVEGASNAKAIAGIQHLLGEQVRKSSQDK